LNCDDLHVRELKNPERKRFREKRRRERVNASFEDLKRILGNFDKQRYLNSGSSTDMSQIEIVNSAITVIHQLLKENMSDRRKIIELQAPNKNEHFQPWSQMNPIDQRNREWGSTEHKSFDLSLYYAQAPT
jgi:Helix-loop-helix DNA-binding domain